MGHVDALSRCHDVNMRMKAIKLDEFSNVKMVPKNSAKYGEFVLFCFVHR